MEHKRFTLSWNWLMLILKVAPIVKKLSTFSITSCSKTKQIVYLNISTHHKLNKFRMQLFFLLQFTSIQKELKNHRIFVRTIFSKILVHILYIICWELSIWSIITTVKLFSILLMHLSWNLIICLRWLKLSIMFRSTVRIKVRSYKLWGKLLRIIIEIGIFCCFWLRLCLGERRCSLQGLELISRDLLNVL